MMQLLKDSRQPKFQVLCQLIAYTRFPFHRTHWEYLHSDEFMGFFDSSTQGFNFQKLKY